MEVVLKLHGKRVYHQHDYNEGDLFFVGKEIFHSLQGAVDYILLINSQPEDGPSDGNTFLNLIDQIKREHDIYTTVSLKPDYKGEDYVIPLYEDAVEYLKGFLESVPEEVIEEKKRAERELLLSQKRSIEERLEELGHDNNSI